MDSIFTKIINGEIPAHRIYEDSNCIAILDIHPVQPGHTLVIPKEQVDQFCDMKSGDFATLMKTSHMLAVHLKRALGKTRVVVRIEGFDVPHAHVHLIPVDHEHESYKEGRMSLEPDHDALRIMAQKLRYET